MPTLTRTGTGHAMGQKLLIAGSVLFILVTCYLGAQDHPNIYVEPFETYVNEVIEIKAGDYVWFDIQIAKGTTLHAKFLVSGGANNKVNVWLLDTANFQLFRQGREFRYFQGTSGAVREVADYAFQIPVSDTYVVILDNRAAQTIPRTVSLYAYGILPNETDEIREAAREFQQIYDELKRVFIFKDFKVFFRHCGMENAFSDPDITICIELMERLAAHDLLPAIVFVLFHELGHTLLKDWDLPLWDNEDVQDEFAVVVSLLAESREAAEAAAKFWSGAVSKDEALSKLYIDDRHALSPQRARNIANWLEDPDELLRRWQKLLIPNMQTKALKKLDKEKEHWINHELIRSELKRRQSAK